MTPLIPTKQLIGLTLASVVLVFFSVGIYQEYQNKQTIAGLDTGLLLQTPKEDIASFREFPSAGPGQEPTISYTYATDKIVGPTLYQGYREDISKRTATAQQFLISQNAKEAKYVGKFYAGVQFMKKGDNWYQTATATTTKSAFLAQTKLTLLDQTKELFGQKVLADTFYSGVGDGDVGRENSSWSTTHDSATGGIASPDSFTVSTYSRRAAPPVDFRIYRSFLPFDTSAISSDTTITTASLNVYVTATSSNNDSNDYINVVQTFQASSITLTVADYEDSGSDNGTAGRAYCAANQAGCVAIQQGATAIDIAGIATSTYTAFTLNSTGRGWIKKSGQTSNCGTTAGYTCLGLREGHDILNDPTAGTNVSSVIFTASEYTGTSQDPYLSITYTVTPPALKLNSGKVKIDSGKIIINNN